MNRLHKTGLAVAGATAVLATLAPASVAAVGPSVASESQGKAAVSVAGTPIGFTGWSGTDKAKISGTYQYWQAGTGGGRALYDGKFSGATAEDKVAGDGYEAVLALKYDEFSGGAWRTVRNKVAVVNGTRSWTFKNKANVVAYACDRKVGTTRLLNCSPWRH
ncbi:hypothetical protein [Streptomyces longisporoflavus]|uniref:Secreted protein n=1 Tax=Streptomyces longisporoflavus TaxID=28044 RepID=A0ABW7QI77_9ACTN